jgi:hypothetical protein
MEILDLHELLAASLRIDVGVPTLNGARVVAT